MWPLSREGYPKQFVNLGGGRTLFKDTLLRIRRISICEDPIVICSKKYRFYASSEMLECGSKGKIILEPSPRNTAPATTLGVLAIAEYAHDDSNDPLVLVLPSDHQLKSDMVFREGVEKAVTLAEQGHIVTFGIVPSGPEIGFGYIQQGEALGDSGYSVQSFVEKPDVELARKMLQKGGYLWNGGMFVFKASVFLRELEKHAPDIYGYCQSAWQGHTVEGNFTLPEKDQFLACPTDSIDYAVMEHTTCAAVVPLQTEWNDLGSWEAFYQEAAKDDGGNVCKGDVILDKVSNCYLHSCDRLIAAIGIKDLAVVETKDAVLISHRNQVQRIKNIVAYLKKSGRSEYEHHPLVYRPWGSYETLAVGDRFQVKRIIVNPGEELSLQLHHHRAEHWIIVSGTAEVTNGDTVNMYTENQSTYIPLGCIHRLKNPGVIPLILIEIQSGSYLGEDDIVRLEDIYGRKI